MCSLLSILMSVVGISCACMMTAYWNMKSLHSCHAVRLTVSLWETGQSSYERLGLVSLCCISWNVCNRKLLSVPVIFSPFHSSVCSRNSRNHKGIRIRSGFPWSPKNLMCQYMLNDLPIFNYGAGICSTCGAVLLPGAQRLDFLPGLRRAHRWNFHVVYPALRAYYKYVT
jgi:hypothetical protein